MRETWVRSLGREDPLEKAMAIHSSIHAWKIPRMEEPGRLQSMGRKESDMTEQLHFLGGSHLTLRFFASSWFPVCCHLLMSLSQSVMWTLKNPPSIPCQPELKTLKKEIHPSVHNHLLLVTHHFLNKWKVSFKTYERLLYLRTNVCPFSSC